MRGFLLIAHGSRRHESNQEVFAITESVKPALEFKFELFQAAFLELCDPDIGTAIDELVNKGAGEITILPYFLNQGRHVIKDVPHEIELKKAQHPDLILNTLPYFGKSNQITDLLVSIVTNNNQT